MTAKQKPLGSVLVVEDETMIRMMLRDMLNELGFDIAAETGDADEVMSLARAGGFDLAILDVNVNGKAISPVADLLEAKQCPFIFVTGYGADMLPDPHRNRPYLQKPFQLAALASILWTFPGARR